MAALRFARWPVVGALILTAFSPPAAEAATGRSSGATGQKKVLVIYSTRRDTQFSTTGDLLIPRLLERQFAQPPDYYAEYLDGARFSDDGYDESFRDYLALKYRGTSFDLVVAMNALAYDFVAEHRDELFHATPLVFLSDTAPRQRLPNSTGVLTPRDFTATLRLAMALQPDTTGVFVVVGHSARDLAMERMARAQFAAFGRSLTYTYSSGFDTGTLERRLAALPSHTIVYYLLFYQDVIGVNVNPLQYLDRVAGVANRPIYSWVDSTIGRGVVGGALESIERRIESVTAVAVRVLHGERAGDIPPTTAGGTVNTIDWRQLQRWSLPARRLPAGTVVLFRPATIWGRVRPYAIGALTVMLLQTALIALLLVQQRALKRADRRIRNLGARLVAAQDQERARLALELHDDVGQQLALLSFDLQVLNGSGTGRDDGVEAVAGEALDRLDRIAHSLHALSHRLHPAMLGSIGLVRAIGNLLRELSRPGLDITFAHSDVPARLPEDVTIALFRVVQEALRNALEHGDATRISVCLQHDAERLLLTVVDDGGGFDVAAMWGSGLGLIGMRDRLDPIGGTVTVRSAPGRGTRVEVNVPIERTKGDDDEAEGPARRRSHDGAHSDRDVADVRV